MRLVFAELDSDKLQAVLRSFVKVLRMPLVFFGIFACAGLAYSAFGIFVMDHWDPKFGSAWGHFLISLQAEPVFAGIATGPVVLVTLWHFQVAENMRLGAVLHCATLATISSIAGLVLANAGDGLLFDLVGLLSLAVVPAVVVLIFLGRRGRRMVLARG